MTINQYNFNAITPDTSGHFTSYSDELITGKIIKILRLECNVIAGSLHLFTSGTPLETLFFTKGDLSSPEISYLGNYNVDNINNSGSPYTSTHSLVNNHLMVIGSGLAPLSNPKVFSGLVIYYEE